MGNPYNTVPCFLIRLKYSNSPLSTVVAAASNLWGDTSESHNSTPIRVNFTRYLML